MISDRQQRLERKRAARLVWEELRKGLLNHYETLKRAQVSPKLAECLAAIRDPNNDVGDVRRICLSHKAAST